MRVATLAALLVLALGLPRLLVLCQHADGDASLVFAHAADSCCHDASEAAAKDHDRDGPVLHPCRRCEHTGLSVELSPAPRPDGAAAPTVPTVCGWSTVWTPPLPAMRALPRHPPATGPPRVDRRTALRATTLLLV
jgi:hypothetical protein